MKNKFFNSRKRKLILTILSCIIGGGLVALPFILIGVTSTQDKYNFVMGNYDDYIAPDVADDFYKEYGLTINTYTASEEVVNNFEKNSMDCAIVPTYEAINLKNKGLLKPVDWSRFNIPNVNDSATAANLFTPLANAMLNNNEQKLNLLDWSIPYFSQDLVFVYRGTEIPELTNASSWLDVINVINNEPRFNAKQTNSKLPKLGIIDDQRTLYSLSSIINNEANITPKNNASIDDLINGYKNLQDKFTNYENASFLFSDSNTLLNKIANNELSGAIVYNGDAMYASFGGDVYSSDPNYSLDENSFHVVKLDETLLALDTIVINKNISDKTLDKFYDMVNQLCLSFNPNNVDQNGDLTDLSYLNFDYVGYTPSLLSLYNYIADETNEYFDYPQIQQQIYKINVDPKNVGPRNLENPINDLTRSNLSFAYIWLKSNIGK